MIGPVRETHTRSVAKAISWRLLGTIATAGIVWVFTREVTLSLSIGALDFALKIGLFWVHERAWDRVHYGRQTAQPVVLWFTGLSGSGKSTIAERVSATLAERRLPVEHLDGDSVRRLFPSTGFSRHERDEHLRRVGFLASRLERHGIVVVASFVSPFRESRDAVRALCTHFIEVYVSTPIEVCEARDVKGLYAKARRGEISDFTGVSAPYEPPEQADLVLDTSVVSLDEAVRRVVELVTLRMAKGGAA